MKPNFNFFLIFALTLTACGTLKQPFEAQSHPPAPDFSDERNWAALPFRSDYADLTPDKSFQDGQAAATADVFFIHPTIYRSKKYWNADVRDSVLNYRVETTTILNQATAFNGSCRVYAPRYRQMSLEGFHVPDTASKWKALRYGYQDIQAAFQYYLEHYNNGRPFIIASHSQGTVHGVWLLRDQVVGKPIEKQLIAAYTVGFPFDTTMLKPLRVCDCPTATDCYMNWNTYLEGKEHKNKEWYTSSAMVNPVSWTINGDASAEAHEGIVWKNFSWDPSRKCHTRSHNGILWFQNPLRTKLPLKKDLHIGDYNLFWANIRKNVAERVAAYQR